MKKAEIALCIEAFAAADGGVGWCEDKGVYHLYLLATEAPIARLKSIDTGGEVRSPTGHIAGNGIFWIWA